MSINHFKIESSINEEIKEEHSEKSSSNSDGRGRHNQLSKIQEFNMSSMSAERAEDYPRKDEK